MIEATLCFLVRGNPPLKILLGHKKVGFGKGKYGGIGGKLESGERAVYAAARELYEETSIRVEKADLRQMGHSACCCASQVFRQHAVSLESGNFSEVVVRLACS